MSVFDQGQAWARNKNDYYEEIAIRVNRDGSLGFDGVKERDALKHAIAAGHSVIENGRAITNFLGHANEFFAAYRDRDGFHAHNKDQINNIAGMAVGDWLNDNLDRKPTLADVEVAVTVLARAGVLAKTAPESPKGFHSAFASSILASFWGPMQTRVVNAVLNSKKNEILSALDQVDQHCFLAGTPIDMWDGTRKPIEEIGAGDVVVSYDANGALKPGRVKRTFENHVRHILDVHGLMVTPGHATFCAQGRYAGRHVPMIDILRSDGALMKKDGGKIRAATGAMVGSREDQFVHAATFEDVPGTDHVRVLERGMLRLGTRYMRPDGESISVLEVIARMGATLTPDGYVRLAGTGEKVPFYWTFGPRLPRPEDYVLQRSRVTLADIYEAEEWEAVGPQMPPPYAGEAGPGFARAGGGVSAPGRTTYRGPNIPVALRAPAAQPAQSRRVRRAEAARKRRETRKIH